MKRIIVIHVFLLAFAAAVWAQDDEVIRVDTELIDVPVVVTDKAGRPVPNLKKSNFVVYEDGKPQEIAEFGETSAPFEVALVLDTSGSARAELDVIKRAAADFIASLRPGDRVAIVAFRTARSSTEAYSAVDYLTPLTSDRRALDAALEKVGTSNGTPFYDSLQKVAAEVFRQRAAPERAGRRAVVALTDGVDSTSSFEYDEIRESLDGAGLANYFIAVDTRDFFEDQLLGPCGVTTRFSVAQIKRYYRVYYPKSRVEKTFDFCKLGEFEKLAISKGLYDLAAKQMKELAQSSGGRVFEIAGLPEARTAFRSVAAELGMRYSIGYYSNNEKAGPGARKIRVELKGVPPGAVVRAREGYLR